MVLKEEVDPIKQGSSAGMSRLSADERRRVIRQQPLAISYQGSDVEIDASTRSIAGEINRLEALGLPVISVRYIFACFAHIIDEAGLDIPYPDYPTKDSFKDSIVSKQHASEIVKAQTTFFSNLMQQLQIAINEDGSASYIWCRPDGDRDLTGLLKESVQKHQGQIYELMKFQGIVNQILDLVKTINTNKHASVIVETPAMAARLNAVRISVNGRGPLPQSWLGYSDKTISSSDESIQHANFLREKVEYARLIQQQEFLAEQVAAGGIELEPAFTTENWPKHPLMAAIKSQVQGLVTKQVAEREVWCDPQDIRYQTIFRLTTHPLTDVLVNGREIVDFLREEGAYQDWRNILNINPDDAKKAIINTDFVKKVVDEQLVIIQHRLRNSSLSTETIKEILGRNGIFGEEGWQLEKEGGQIYAVKKDSDAVLELDRRVVHFEPADPEIATAYHHAFHYIHTPRTERAFQLRLEGETLPFSVAAFQTIDRDYKRNAALMHGFDPRRCIDLARLYSWPGTPFNTSSTMFSAAFSHFKEKNSDIQAVFSAFMPTYATGQSMLSGGFDRVVLAKPLKHYFGQKVVDGHVVREHLTKRRLNESSDVIGIDPSWPMLPVIELMSSLSKPRFKAMQEVKGKMIIVKK